MKNQKLQEAEEYLRTSALKSKGQIYFENEVISLMADFALQHSGKEKDHFPMTEMNGNICIACGKSVEEHRGEQPEGEVNGYQELFNHMSQEHGITLTQGEMMDIVYLVQKNIEIELSQKYLQPQKQAWLKERRELVDRLESKLNPKYMNTHLTWGQVKKSLEELLNKN